MGRQVSFYMTQEDEGKFLEFLKTTGDIAILPYASTTEQFTPMKSFSSSPIPKFAGAFWLLNRSASKKLVVRFVPAQRYYTIDSDSSSVVQFLRSGVKEKVMYRGRLWVELKYLDKQKMTLMPKEAEFGNWYDTVAKWIRKNYKRLEELIYAGPGAQKLIEKGFALN